jgi:glutathionylspermidine synthase
MPAVAKMRRVRSTPRVHWQSRVEAAGLTWHSAESAQVYWNESAFYEFTSKEIEALEACTSELAGMTLHAAEHIIENKLYSKLGIPESAVRLIEDSWEAEPPSLYGRFDLAYDGANPPKLLEYNADTPTSLLEAAVIQWHWLKDQFPSCDQFNSIHDRLIARWKELKPFLPDQRVDFCSIDDVEDGTTVTYLLDTARQAGLVASIFPIDEIGWNGGNFVGPDELPLGAVFKLYPWEWMVREEFGTHLGKDRTMWIEPPWKCCCRTKESCRFFGISIRSIRICWRPASIKRAGWRRGSESRCSAAKAQTSHCAKEAWRSRRMATTAPRVSSSRN